MDLAPLVFDSEIMRWMLGTFGLIGAVLVVVGLLVSRAESRIRGPIIQAGGTLAFLALALTVGGWAIG